MLFFSACSKKDKAEPDSSTSPQSTDDGGNVKEKAEHTLPLTGISTTEKSDHRAIAAVLNNHPLARPQTGLSKADIVYEVLAEGTITRFLAIYQSEMPENLGPIRSARNYFIELAQGYNSLFIAHGYSPDVKELLDAGGIDHLNGINYDGTLFKRTTDRKAPHNSYITFEHIKEGAKTLGYSLETAPEPLEFFTEEESENMEGEPVKNIKIAYSKNDQFVVNYEIASNGKFNRYSNGQQALEYESNVPIQPDNIFVVEASHEVVDSAGRRTIDLQSGGKAYLFQKGFVKELEWKNEQGRIIPFENGHEAKLVPGKTWIQIVPTMNIVSFN